MNTSEVIQFLTDLESELAGIRTACNCTLFDEIRALHAKCDKRTSHKRRDYCIYSNVTFNFWNDWSWGDKPRFFATMEEAQAEGRKHSYNFSVKKRVKVYKAYNENIQFLQPDGRWSSDATSAMHFTKREVSDNPQMNFCVDWHYANV